MIVDIDQVSAFLAIARLRGFTKASASLHISQPAISRRIHLLEQELDAQLFERIHDGVILTDAGRALLPHAEALLASVRDGINAVEALRGTSAGSVTLALVGTLASTALTECLRAFRDAHPAVDLRIRTALSAEVSSLVRRGDATLGLRYDLDPDPHLVCSAVYGEPMVAVCSPRHRLAQARQVEPAALAGECWITFPPRPGGVPEPYARTLEHWRATCGLRDVQVMPIDSLTAQKRMVEADFGLALLPASSIDEELRSGTLHALRVNAAQPTIPVILIHRRNTFRSGVMQALMAAITAWPQQQQRQSR
jgi:DNA-binding transcriptional LysR family regulator